ncbi:mannosyltransferase family protein [Actinopolymorpha alba]|uniref:mannosyltransferase family protein n=1 Tax=Actinopolymorpha alba TaxID=533267 RepID=UPI001ED9BA6D|nr:mannosyltransferase family protein [Actinopolymorpha alba]
MSKRRRWGTEPPPEEPDRRDPPQTWGEDQLPSVRARRRGDLPSWGDVPPSPDPRPAVEPPPAGRRGYVDPGLSDHTAVWPGAPVPPDRTPADPGTSPAQPSTGWPDSGDQTTARGQQPSWDTGAAWGSRPASDPTTGRPSTGRQPAREEPSSWEADARWPHASPLRDETAAFTDPTRGVDPSQPGGPAWGNPASPRESTGRHAVPPEWSAEQTWSSDALGSRTPTTGPVTDTGWYGANDVEAADRGTWTTSHREAADDPVTRTSTGWSGPGSLGYDEADANADWRQGPQSADDNRRWDDTQSWRDLTITDPPNTAASGAQAAPEPPMPPGLAPLAADLALPTPTPTPGQGIPGEGGGAGTAMQTRGAAFPDTDPSTARAGSATPVPPTGLWSRLPSWARLSRNDLEVLAWWTFTRIGILLVALAGPWLFLTESKVPGFLDRWQQWDFWHFDRIATHGYFAKGWDTPVEAFFPGFPALLSVGHAIGLPTAVAGLCVSFVAGAIAAIALGRLADAEWGQGAGRRAAAMWMLAPPAIFLAAPYTESLFLGFAIPAWLAARRGHWWVAGLLAAGASTVRVSGVFLIAALVVEFLTSRKRRDWVQGAWLALPLVPLLGYMAYLRVNTGDWMRWYHAQSQEWYRGATFPVESLLNTVDAATGQTTFGDVSEAVRANWEWMFRAELVAMLVGLVVTVTLLALQRWGEATWVGIQVIAFSTSYWFFSVPRATLLWFPLWMGLAALAVRWTWVWRIYLVLAVPLFGVWAAAYLTGRWSG